jgi:methyltransferase
MTMAYPGAFLVMTLESAWRARGIDSWFFAGLGLWLGSKVLKYAAIRALGRRWSFRVLVVEGETLVTHGPYRFLRHPNYVAVVGELLAMAFLAPAPLTGPVAMLGFGWLIRRRIGVEEQALRGSRPL